MKTRLLTIICMTFLCGATVSGCGAFHPGDYPKNGPTVKATANPMTITKAELGHTWPFKNFNFVTVSCDQKGDDVILRVRTPQGKQYALNGVDENNNLPAVEEVADGSVGTLRSFGFSVCDIKK